MRISREIHAAARSAATPFSALLAAAAIVAGCGAQVQGEVQGDNNPCPAGLVHRGQACVEANSCAASPCFAGVTCTDVAAPGTGFTCGACPPGYVGDGVTCANFDACAAKPCAAGVTCTDLPPPSTGFSCGACPAGYVGDGNTCKVYDGCAASPCFEGVDCTDLPPPSTGFTCGSCPTGYAGDGVACADFDACASKPCFAGVTCTDLPPPSTSFECGPCPFLFAGDGVTCTDRITTSTVKINAVDYTAYRVPGFVYRVVCPQPCSLSDEVNRAQYRGFARAREQLLQLSGVDIPAANTPFDVHTEVDLWCGPKPSYFTFFSGRYPPSAGVGLAPNYGTYACMYLQDNSFDLTPSNLELAKTNGGHMHEYTHALFYNRHYASYESFAYALSFPFFMAPPFTDLCDSRLDFAGGRLLYRLCQEYGFNYGDIPSSLQQLDALYQSGAGWWYPETSIYQYRLILNQILGAETMPVFLEVGYYPNQVGDSTVLASSGGTFSLVNGWISGAVPAGALASNLPVKVDITSYSPYHPKIAAPAVYEIVPVSRTYPTPAMTAVFAKPVTLTIHYAPDHIAPGVAESDLVLLCRSASPFVYEVVPGSYVDTTAHTVTGEITSLGLYAVAPPP